MTLNQQEENKPLWNLINETFNDVCFAYHCPPVIRSALLITQSMLSSEGMIDNYDRKKTTNHDN